MTAQFEPKLQILPAIQRGLWPELHTLASLGFTLYGGTAIALRLGHRQSIDFDFFSDKPLNREALTNAFPRLRDALTLQDQGNTWVLLTDAGADAGVKLSFFGGIDFGRIGIPQMTADLVLRVAAFEDLMATKLKVVLQRAEAKDYRDIAAMIAAGVDLAAGLAAARVLFGANFQPSESLKALSYFADGDLPSLSVHEQRILIQSSAVVGKLPRVSLSSNSLS